MFGSNKFELSKYIDASINDASVAFMKVATKRYGEKSLCGVKDGFFSTVPIRYASIQINCDEYIKGIVSLVRINAPALQADFDIQVDDSGQVFINSSADEKFKTELEDFLNAVETHVKTDSIYRGKAISLGSGFLDISGNELDHCVYNPEVFLELDTHIWTLIEKGARCKDLGIRRQRKILLLGTFGAGKTLTARLTAKKAIANGWTFFYLPPTSEGGVNAIRNAFQIARRYQPALIFIEDIDHEQRLNSQYAFKSNLSVIDGLISKNNEIIVIMTANKSDDIDGALLRPGRIDKVIKLGILNVEDIKRLITKVIRSEHLEEDINWDELARQCSGYPPAFIIEVATNAILNMISQNHSKTSTEILVRAAQGLKEQFKACEKSFGFKK